jgi:hypothetical protein
MPILLDEMQAEFTVNLSSQKQDQDVNGEELLTQTHTS